MRPNKWVVLAGLVALCYGVALQGSVATERGLGPWYESLLKPPFTPPDWAVGLVWTVLYGLMAVATWLVWRDRDSLIETKRAAYTLFGLQLVLNALWPWLFFAFKMIDWAFVEIVWLLVVAQAAGYAYYKASRLAGLLMLPYMAWLAFATLLNYAVLRMN